VSTGTGAGGPVPALVVGAGPVGLATALALRARGVPVTVLEADPHDRVRPGLGTGISGYGVVWRTRRTLHRGREVYAQTFAPPKPGSLPPFASLRQVDTERFLLDACHEAGVTFRWDARVTEVTATADAATVTTGDGRRWPARYVIAADGARSAVRAAVGIALHGDRSEGHHVVVDVADPAGEMPVERVFHYEHPAVGGRTVLRVPFAGGFQVDLQCRDDDPPGAYGTEEAVQRWLPGVVGPAWAERVLWVSTYRFLQVVADAFRDPSGRVLLVGEAAHLFPPFGARGMNSGIADAESAADAVAVALDNPADADAAVDTFARRRRGAAVFNSRAAGTALSHLRPGRVMRARQHAAAALAPMLPRCGSWLEHAPYGPRHGSPGDEKRRY
jgi:3-(3-hydroxy-phenyl)propionate hydroxylase